MSAFSDRSGDERQLRIVFVIVPSKFTSKSAPFSGFET